jgi:hypothetical protein
MKSETDGSRHLRLRGVDRNGSVILEVAPRHRATDAMLTPPTRAEEEAYSRASLNPDMLGRVWLGDMKLVLDATKKILGGIGDRKAFHDAKRRLMRDIEALPFYGEEPLASDETENGPAGSLRFGANGTQDGGGNAMRAWRNQDFARIENVQNQLDKFYQKKRS